MQGCDHLVLTFKPLRFKIKKIYVLLRCFVPPRTNSILSVKARCNLFWQPLLKAFVFLMDGWAGGRTDGSEVDEGECRWQMGVAAEPAGQGNPRLPLHPALWGEMGGADRETGRKPLWGSIVLQMNRRLQRAFSAPLCGAKGGQQQNTHTLRTQSQLQ